MGGLGGGTCVTAAPHPELASFLYEVPVRAREWGACPLLLASKYFHKHL